MDVVIYGAMGEDGETVTCYAYAMSVAAGLLATNSNAESKHGPFAIILSVSSGSADWFTIECTVPDSVDISMYYITTS
jgi:hypothetical protein